MQTRLKLIISNNSRLKKEDFHSKISIFFCSCASSTQWLNPGLILRIFLTAHSVNYLSLEVSYVKIGAIILLKKWWQKKLYQIVKSIQFLLCSESKIKTIIIFLVCFWGPIIIFKYLIYQQKKKIPKCASSFPTTQNVSNCTLE